MRPKIVYLVLVVLILVIFSCRQNKYEDFCEKGVEFDQVVFDDSVKIYIPTGFTPNGDGMNDFYSFVCKGIQHYTVSIKKNFTTHYTVSTDNSNWHWDGKNKNGEINDGEYDVEATLMDDKGKLITLKSTIALVQNPADLPCRCSRMDQIDRELGFISSPSENCE